MSHKPTARRRRTAGRAFPPAPGRLRFRLEPSGPELVSRPQIAIVAGYTGRDRDAVLGHIRELEELGIAPPPDVPIFYSVAPELITQEDAIVTTETATSGEAEVGLVVDGGQVYVTVASDHTDRAVERIDIAVSKRLCPKVIATAAWRLDDVAAHWDSLRLRSWIGDEGDDLYQDGLLSSLVAPLELLEAIPWRLRPQSFLLLGGTVPTIGGMRQSPRFRAELHDPVTDRKLRLDYRIQVLDFIRPDSASEGRIRRLDHVEQPLRP